MKNKKINPIDINSSTENTDQTDGKKPYSTPKLLRYGGLTELVQLQPNRGRDGEVTFVDCTMS